MRSRRPTPEHEQAVARRLALLSAELATVRHDGPTDEPQAERAPRDELPATPSSWPWDAHTRIRAEQPAPPDADGGEEPRALDPVGTPALLPLPGRHAARRGVLRWLPEGLRGHLTLQPAHLAVVATAVAVALGWTTWWVVTGQPETTAVPVPGAAAPVTPAVSPVAAPVSPGAMAGDAPTGPAGPVQAEGGGAEGSPGQPAEVVVDVAGKVRRPGIAVLPTGSRVVDALKAAGGARRGVDLTGLNLARLLVDGEQILVGVQPAAGAPSGTGPGTAAGGATGLVSLNQADQTLLETLPGVGPVTAGAIITWRSQNGGFSAVEELLEVDGIGEATLAKLAPLVTL